MNQKNKQKLLPSFAHSRSSPSKCYTDIKSFSFLLFRFIGCYDLIWDPVPDVLQLPLPMKPAHPQCCVCIFKQFDSWLPWLFDSWLPWLPWPCLYFVHGSVPMSSLRYTREPTTDLNARACGLPHHRSLSSATDCPLKGTLSFQVASHRSRMNTYK